MVTTIRQETPTAHGLVIVPPNVLRNDTQEPDDALVTEAAGAIVDAIMGLWPGDWSTRGIARLIEQGSREALVGHYADACKCSDSGRAGPYCSSECHIETDTDGVPGSWCVGNCRPLQDEPYPLTSDPRLCARYPGGMAGVCSYLGDPASTERRCRYCG